MKPLQTILPWTISVAVLLLVLIAISRRAQGQITMIRNLLVACGAFWISLWTVGLLGGLFGKLNNGIIYSDENLLSAVAMGVMTSMGRTIASILAGAVVMVSADSQKPERWASIIALLYVIDAPVHYGPYHIAPTAWDHLTRGVDLVFPGIACLLAVALIAHLRRKKPKS
jgi:hypothetical protein